MTLSGWAVAVLVIGTLTLGLGRELIEFGERAVLFWGEALLWLQSLLAG